MTKPQPLSLMQGASMRTRWVSFSILALFGIIALRGAAMALAPFETKSGVSAAFDAPTQRADIVDRNGDLLATSVSAYSVFADPRAIGDPAVIIDELEQVLTGLNRDKLMRALANKERAFVWIDRGLTPRQKQSIFDLGLEGIGFRREARRAYPRGSLAGHVLGFAGNDGQGLGGLEYALDARLRSADAPVQLTLDANVQFSLEVELSAAIGEYNAEAGAGVVLNAKDGEILAMASWPPLDPHRATDLKADDPALLNRASHALYELGSVYKPLTIAAALDAGAIHPEDRFDVREPLLIKGRKISDDHPIIGLATPLEIIADSSNIGTVKVAWQLGARRQQAFFDSLGLLARAPIELAGTAAPLNPDQLDELTSATTSYGHGIAVSPLSFASAFSALANNGELVKPTLLKTKDRQISQARVMAAPTASIVTQMMRRAVTSGTGRRADVPGYRVAGKTGTAEKPIAGGYSETENICSFAAIFPADSPEYVVLVVLDTPKAGVNRGRAAGWNAAPTAGRIIERIAPILGVPPRFDAQDGSPRMRSVSHREGTTL